EGVILKRLAPNLTRGFAQDLVLGGAIPPVSTGNEVGDLLINTLRNASASQGISVFSRRVLNPGANRVLDQRAIDALTKGLVDPRTITLSPDPAANVVPGSNPLIGSPDATVAPGGGSVGPSKVATPAFVPTPRDAARAETILRRHGIDVDPRIFETGPVLPDVAFPTGVRPDGPPRSPGAFDEAIEFLVPPVDIDGLPTFPTDANVHFEAAFGFPQLGQKPDGTEFSVADPLTPEQSTKIQRVTDGTILGINVAAPVLDTLTVKLLEALGLDENYVIRTGARSLSTGLAVGVPISIAQRKFAAGAFVLPTAQSTIAIVVSDALFQVLPQPAKQAVIDACGDENVIVNGLKWFACNVGPNPNTGSDGSAGGPPTPPAGAPSSPVATSAPGPASTVGPVATVERSPTGALPPVGDVVRRRGSDGQEQVLVNSYDLVGDGQGSTGSVQVYEGADGSREAVIVAPKTERADGTTVLFVPEVGGNRLSWSPGAQSVVETRSLGSGSGAPTGSRPVVIRTSAQQIPLLGDGAESTIGGTAFVWPTRDPTIEEVTVYPARKFHADGSASTWWLLPPGETVDSGAISATFLVPAGTKLVSQAFVPPAARSQNQVGQAAVGPAIVGEGIVGEGIVGPKIVGPKIVGPKIVGEGIVGPAIVGPGTVGTRASSPFDFVGGLLAGAWERFADAVRPDPWHPLMRRALYDPPADWQERIRDAFIVPLGFGIDAWEVQFVNGRVGVYDLDGRKRSGAGPSSITLWRVFESTSPSSRPAPGAARTLPAPVRGIPIKGVPVF
ncbi:MAG: hypothetical protein AAFP84_19125, partial [Actinomycetota bacterium]